MDKATRTRLFQNYEARMFDLRLTIKQTCDRAGVTPAAYSYAKNGSTKRPLKVVREIERALDELEAERTAAWARCSS